MSNSAVPVRQRQDFLHHRDGGADCFAACEVESDGAQRTAGGINEMPTPDILSLAATPYQDLGVLFGFVRSRTAICAASMPPLGAVIVNRTAWPSGSSCGHR